MLNSSYVFSYWIFLWYILYICKIVIYNPKIILYFSLFIIIIEILYLIYYNAPYKKLIVYITINIFLKVFTLLSIINTKINYKNDLLFTLLLLFIYYIYMKINNESFINYYIKLLNGYISKERNDNESIFFKFFYNIFFTS